MFKVAPLLACAAIVLGHPALPTSAQSIRSRQSPVRDVPSWVRQPPADDGKNYSFVGVATSASESQARNSAYSDAVSKAVVRIGARLFEDPTVVTWYGTDALRDYVRKVARNAAQYVRPDRGGYTAYALLQLNRGFVEPSAVREYASSSAVQRQTPTAVGYLLVPTVVSPAGVTKRTQVRMPNLRQGNFYLYFTLAGTKGGVWIRLDQIQVFDDGSVGTTRWRFDVFVNGAKAFSTPVAGYTDDVITYRMRAGDRSMETQASSAGGLIEIRIAGYRVSAARAK